MTPEKRVELTTLMAANGLSLLLARDFDALLLQLAHLAQFERLLLQAADGNPHLECAIAYVKKQQTLFDEPAADQRALELLDIPTILCRVSGALHEALATGNRINIDLTPTATAVFVKILCPER